MIGMIGVRMIGNGWALLAGCEAPLVWLANVDELGGGARRPNG
jgi:hypothetical protein